MSDTSEWPLLNDADLTKRNSASRHLPHTPEVNIHFPIAAVERSIIQQELEGSSVPDLVWSFGHSNGVLRAASNDPGAFVFVAIPPHEAVSLESITNEDDLLVEIGTVKSMLREKCVKDLSI